METNTNSAVAAPEAGQIVRYEFGAQQVQSTGETASGAVAAREQAAVAARYQMALMRRRNVDQFRVDLLKECQRPGFAEMAEYHRPVGSEYNRETGKWEQKIATGPSVHLIRTAVALYGNMLVDSATMFDSRDIRLVHAYVLDLERNVSWARTVAIPKQVEKRAVQDKKTHQWGPPADREVVGERTNTEGFKTYTVLATEDEIRIKEARLLAIAQRENGRSVLPRDIVDEAVRMARKTIETTDAQDPDAARRKIIDNFVEFGIKPEALAEYIGHSLDTLTPKEVKELRGVFVSIREGESTWEEIMTVKNPAGTKEAAAAVAAKKLSKLGLGKKDTPTTEAPVQSGAQASEAPGSGGTPSAPPSGVPEHQSTVGQYQKEIGDVAFFRILGSNGCESVADVTPNNWKVIAEAMNQEVQDQRAAAPRKGKLKL